MQAETIRSGRASSRKLVASIEEVAAIETSVRLEMFRLYAGYYQPANAEIFQRDLADKTHAVLLRDERGFVRGFSTIKLWEAEPPGGRVTFMYSGDTIIARAFWGSQALPFQWIEFAGRLKAANPTTPLYWLLISKGHRTYRLLSAFARRYYPTWRGDTPGQAVALMHFAGREMFGSRFDAQAGIVRHDGEAAALKADYAVIEPTQRLHPEIAHFLHLNPGHAQGDELLCLCELSAENLQPMARVQFLRGYDRSQLGSAA